MADGAGVAAIQALFRGGLQLTPERYQQVKQLFVEVCELAPDQRAAHLDRACAQDAELRAEVETLLANDWQPLPVEESLV